MYHMNLLDIVCIHGEYNILFIDDEKRLLQRINTNMQIFDVYTGMVSNERQTNNVYITKYKGTALEGDMEVIDYTGNVVFEGQYVLIDTLNEDSDTIINCNDKEITIYSKKLQLKRKINVSHNIEGIRFTKHPYVIIIDMENGKSYFLNVYTQKVSKSYDRVYKNIGMVQDKIYIVDLDTLESELKFTDVENLNLSQGQFVISYSDTTKHYTLDLEPLLHEF